MTGHTERFTGRVAEYERYRQRYPAPEILALLRDWCGLEPQHLVADIGAGTGMLAEVFLGNGNEVLAVEPNQQMRAVCEKMISSWPKLRIIDATAEQTGIGDASIDLVAVGRAFHWFDQARALEEFRRILKPGRWLALVSAGRATTNDAQFAAFAKLLLEHGTDPNYLRAGHRIHEHLDELFPGGEIRRTEIAGALQLSLDELIGQVLSYSVAPLPGHPKHEGMVRALEDFFAQFSADGMLTMPTTCWVTCGRFASGS